MECQNGEYSISTDPNKADIDAIHRYLSEESYWAKERPKAVVEKAIRNSLCFSVIEQEKLAGFARVITDYGVNENLCVNGMIRVRCSFQETSRQTG